MRNVLYILTAICLVQSINGANNVHHATSSPLSREAQLLHDLQAEIKQMKQTMSGLTNQMMLQQLFVEERIRSDGNSGVKQIRNTESGTKPYHHAGTAHGSFLSFHEHANYDRTVGLGEFIGVLNGVEFRTRHNDYKLKMPSHTKKDYHAVEDIPFPAVPPSVLSKKTVHEQIAEMQQYFKAFRDQNTKLRNYAPYFKPILCYLEGAWTTDTKTLDEPFQSDRHFIDATSWFDLQQKIRFMSASGGKNQFENFSYLPTKIINVTDSGEPVYAQWNYRIICHPIKYGLKLQDFRPIDDMAPRMYSRRNYTMYVHHNKQTRFGIAYDHGRSYHWQDGFGTYYDRHGRYALMDKIMNEIPGVDNYPGNLTDTAFDMLKYRIDQKQPTVLNTARYHRHYKVMKKGAMGTLTRSRGYSDATVWMAQTTNPRIANVGCEDCQRNTKTHKMECKHYEARTTYAIPLEIIWLTPLSTWNPYNLSIITRSRDYHKVTDHGRNGGLDKTHAYNGTALNNYYITPAEFYHGGEANRDPADTAKDVVGVLDQHGEVKRTSAAGIRIFTPDIPHVGSLRMRYPIAPLHQEGSATWKNLIALQDIMMDMHRYTYMFEHRPEITDLDAHAPDTHYITSTTHFNPPGMHKHDLYLTAEEMQALLKNGTVVSVFTTTNNGHSHELELSMIPSLHGNQQKLQIISCDGQKHCWDHHNNNVYKQRY